MQEMERVAINGMMPDMTLIFDIDPVEGLKRASSRRGAGQADRFEKEDIDIHQRRRRAFLDIAEKEPDRCIVIDASGNVDSVENLVTAAVFAGLEARTKATAGRAKGA